MNCWREKEKKVLILFKQQETVSTYTLQRHHTPLEQSLELNFTIASHVNVFL